MLRIPKQSLKRGQPKAWTGLPFENTPVSIFKCKLNSPALILSKNRFLGKIRRNSDKIGQKSLNDWQNMEGFRFTGTESLHISIRNHPFRSENIMYL